MPVLTILNHGTANSTNTNTSEGCVLVISKIASLLQGPNWILNEGAGTEELRMTGVVSPGGAGVAGGKGVEANVARSVAWVKQRQADYNGQISLNLAGHSRGSITCYKIARALCNDPATTNIPINIFAIDPVPGNTGDVFTSNGENYKNIILGGNVWRGKSFLMLAESEHRLVFRPYVDALYSVGLPSHRCDTIPGTHGGINMLEGPEDEAAKIVLSRALDFLMDHDSEMDRAEALNLCLFGEERLSKYSALMCRIKKYKAHATVNPLRGAAGLVNFAMSGFQVDKHRTANVVGSKAKFGATVAGPDDAASDTKRREDFHGMNLAKGLTSVSNDDVDDRGQSTRPHRFFCNVDHQTLFRTYRGSLYDTVRSLERSGMGSQGKAALKATVLGAGMNDFGQMDNFERTYFTRFLAKRGIDLDA